MLKTIEEVGNRKEKQQLRKERDPQFTLSYQNEVLTKTWKTVNEYENSGVPNVKYPS